MLNYNQKFYQSSSHSINNIYSKSGSPFDYETDENLSNKVKLKNESQSQLSTLRPRSASPKKTIKSGN